ncbi:hypothetical protein E1091_16330, partial [Micromonospora fluostatini]
MQPWRRFGERERLGGRAGLGRGSAGSRRGPAAGPGGGARAAGGSPRPAGAGRGGPAGGAAVHR